MKDINEKSLEVMKTVLDSYRKEEGPAQGLIHQVYTASALIDTMVAYFRVNLQTADEIEQLDINDDSFNEVFEKLVTSLRNQIWTGKYKKYTYTSTTTNPDGSVTVSKVKKLIPATTSPRFRIYPCSRYIFEHIKLRLIEAFKPNAPTIKEEIEERKMMHKYFKDALSLEKFLGKEA